MGVSQLRGLGRDGVWIVSSCLGLLRSFKFNQVVLFDLYAAMDVIVVSLLFALHWPVVIDCIHVFCDRSTHRAWRGALLLLVFC